MCSAQEEAQTQTFSSTSQHRPAPALHIVSFENFVKSMPPSLSELKVTPSFCFPFKIPDDPTFFIRAGAANKVENFATKKNLQKRGHVHKFLSQIIKFNFHLLMIQNYNCWKLYLQYYSRQVVTHFISDLQMIKEFRKKLCLTQQGQILSEVTFHTAIFSTDVLHCLHYLPI